MEANTLGFQYSLHNGLTPGDAFQLFVIFNYSIFTAKPKTENSSWNTGQTLTIIWYWACVVYYWQNLVKLYQNYYHPWDLAKVCELIYLFFLFCKINNRPDKMTHTSCSCTRCMDWHTHFTQYEQCCHGEKLGNKMGWTNKVCIIWCVKWRKLTTDLLFVFQSYFLLVSWYFTIFCQFTVFIDYYCMQLPTNQ